MNTGSCFNALSGDNTNNSSSNACQHQSQSQTTHPHNSDNVDEQAPLEPAPNALPSHAGPESHDSSAHIHHGYEPSRATGELISRANPISGSNGQRPLILITDSNQSHQDHRDVHYIGNRNENEENQSSRASSETQGIRDRDRDRDRAQASEMESEGGEEEKFEEVDGIRYRIVSAVTKPATKSKIKRQDEASDKHRIHRNPSLRHPPEDAIIEQQETEDSSLHQSVDGEVQQQNRWLRRDTGYAHHRVASMRSGTSESIQSKLNSVRRKSTAFVSNFLHSTLVNESDNNNDATNPDKQRASRRLSIYEMTKSPPPETSLEIYLNERRRSSNVSAKHVQQQIEQKSTFETNYNQRQQYFKDLNQKLLNQDRKLLNVVANRGHIHRHSVDIAQLPLNLALAKSASAKSRHRTDTTTADEASTNAGTTIQQQPINQAKTDWPLEDIDGGNLRAKVPIGKHASISEDKSISQSKLNLYIIIIEF